ncbi:hypothetical protein ACF0H5_021005 [Mactra antiquata]
MAGADEEGKKKALTYYKILAAVWFVLGAGLLILAIIATLNRDPDLFGPPYFIGGYIAGILGLIVALQCGFIAYKGPNATSNEDKKNLGSLIQFQYMTSFFLIFGCIVGLIMAGIGGIANSDELSSLNNTLAIVIMVGCIIGLVCSIGSICVVSTYGKYFGLIMKRSGRKGRMVMVNIHATGVNDSTVHPTGNSSRVNELQRENELIQQQIELQKQLNQQQQYGGGFTGGPPPPPAYTSDPVYPPR